MVTATRAMHYKFDIIYTQRILRVNEDGSLSANALEFNAILRILRDNAAEFPI